VLLCWSDGNEGLKHGGQGDQGRDDEQKRFDRAVDVILDFSPITVHFLLLAFPQILQHVLNVVRSSALVEHAQVLEVFDDLQERSKLSEATSSMVYMHAHI